MKYFKRVLITFGIGFLIYSGASYALDFVLDKYNISIKERNFDFPSTLHLLDVSINQESFSGKIDQINLEWSWSALLNGNIKSKNLAVVNGIIKLNKDNQNIQDSTEKSSLNLPNIEIENILLKNIQILSEGKNDTLDILFPNLKIIDLNFDGALKIDSLINTENHIYFAFLAENDNSEKIANQEANSGFDFSAIPEFSINALDFSRCDFTLSNTNQQHKISNLDFDLHGFKSSDLLDLGINNLSLTYQDTLDVSILMDDVHLNKRKEGEITDLVFDFPGLHLDLPSIIFSDENDLKIDLKTNASTLSTSLIKIFQPDFQSPLKQDINIKLDGEVSYSKAKIDFTDFNISLPESKQTSLKINGFANLPGNQDSVEIKISDFHTSLSDINEFYELNSNLNEGSLVINSELKLEGTFENLDLKGAFLLNKTKLNLYTRIDRRQPEMEVNFGINSPYLDPSQLMSSIPSDYKSSNISLSGNVLLDTAMIPIHSKLSLSSDSIFIKDRWYNHPEILLSQDRKMTSLLVESKEEKITLFLETLDDVFNYKNLSYSGYLKSKIPDQTDFLITKGDFYSSFNGNYLIEEKTSNVIVNFDTLQLKLEEESYLTNANIAFQQNQSKGMEVKIESESSEVLHFEVTNEIFDWLELENKWEGNYPKASLNFSLELDSILIRELTGLNAYINLNEWQLTASGDSIISALNISQMHYEAFEFDEIAAKVNTFNHTLNGNFLIASFDNPYSDLDSLDLEVNTGIDGIIGLALSSWVPEIINSFQIACQLQPIEDKMLVKLDPSKPLEFGDATWETLENQGLTFSPRPAENVGGITIGNKQQKISIKSAEEAFELIIDSLYLTPIFDALALDYSLEGYLNLDTEYSPKREYLNWEGNIEEFSVDSIQLGTLNFNGFNYPDELQVVASSSYENSKINLSVTKKEDPIDFKINLAEFNLQTLSKVLPSWPETMGLSGFLNAKVEGSYDNELHSEGFVAFENTKFQMDEYGIFTQSNDSIFLENTDFIFHNFHLADKKGNLLTINGNYSLGSATPIDLQLKTDLFRLLEKADKNGDLTGEIDIATNLKFKGHSNDLSISGYFNTLQNSNIFYKYKSSVSLEEREKVIAFTSFDEEIKETPIKKVQRGNPINWNVDFNIGKTDVYILLYETTQDYIKMEAKGNLQLREGISDEPWIFGSIESTEGSVFYDAPMVSDLNLKIEKAAIKWEGEFSKPRIDFRGTEVFRISPSELSSGFGDKKERAGVTVLAIVDDKPLEDFDLTFDMKSSNSEIGSQLQKLPASTRETYAINLLLFGKIDPSTESGSSSYMQGVVAKLNEITRRNLKNADLSFYIDSSNETELAGDEHMNRFGYSFSQGLFNKRVRLSLGGNIDLNNNTPGHIQKFNPLGSIQIDYILSEKPYIALVGSRRNTYTGAIDGQVDKASFGLNYQKRFRNFSSIFSKKKKIK